MNEQFCDVGDIRLCYETFGDPSDPAMLLVMGLGTQMVGWPQEFCRMLAAEGFFVVRFDNRDVGHSSKIDAPIPTLGQIVRRSRAGAAYSLRDMAADAAGLLEHLQITSAHVVGVSMGGMIAQVMAIGHPQRVSSLTSIMSNTGALLSGQPAPEVLPIFLRRRRRTDDKEQYVAETLAVFARFGSRGAMTDQETLAEVLREGFDRDRDLTGGARHLAAVIAGRDRTKALRTLDVPALVIHGTADRLVLPSGGKATAKAIPGARLVLIKDMGHDLPRGAWAQIVAEITANAARAGAAQPAGIS